MTPEEKAAELRHKKERYEKCKAAGRCTNCGKKVSAGKLLCIDCSLRHRRRDKRYYDAHRRVKTDFSDGLCRLCNEPAVPEKTLCARHYAIALENLRKANAQRSNDHPWRCDNRLIFNKKD